MATALVHIFVALGASGVTALLCHRYYQARIDTLSLQLSYATGAIEHERKSAEDVARLGGVVS